MAEPISREPGRQWGSALTLTGFAALALALGIDFHFDVRARDAFSWMDPYQYFDFARGLLSGAETVDSFELPSLFPFLMLPALALEASIPAALWINFAATLLLMLGIHWLCRELEMATPSPIVAVLVVSSPLLTGLSRTLYVEYTLSALVALGFAVWLRLLKSPDWRTASLFAAVFAVGVMTKMTFPVFFLLPVAAAVVGRLAGGRDREAFVLAVSSLGPLLLVLLVQESLFARSFGYYLSLGNTTIPIMAAIGPPDSSSWNGAFYYFDQIGRSLLFLLTPWLVFAIVRLWRSRSRPRAGHLCSRQTLLWLWLIGAPLVLMLPAAKEPRHIAPCVLPAMLLIAMGIESLTSRRLRFAALGLGLLAAVLQYAAVTLHVVETPYFMDRALHLAEIEEAISEAGPEPRYRSTPAELRDLHWNYDRNVAISGFPANEALALTWSSFPGVVYDLDTFDAPERMSEGFAYERFEDLYILSSFNTYNRRCGYRWYNGTLGRNQVIANADFLIVNTDAGAETGTRFPGHEVVATIPREDGSIQVLRNAGPDPTPYRTLYARSFLEREPAPAGDELRLVARELVMAAALAGDFDQVRALAREFPVLVEGDREDRNIYWIAGYPALLLHAQDLLGLATTNR